MARMSLDRSDVQYSAKEVCANVANPAWGSYRRLKTAGRYLKGVQKVTWVMQAWESVDTVTVDGREDSACVEHGRSRIPTAEAEYQSVITGAAKAPGMQSMFVDLGLSA